jgi:hypothetical protein
MMTLLKREGKYQPKEYSFAQYMGYKYATSGCTYLAYLGLESKKYSTIHKIIPILKAHLSALANSDESRQLVETLKNITLGWDVRPALKAYYDNAEEKDSDFYKEVGSVMWTLERFLGYNDLRRVQEYYIAIYHPRNEGISQLNDAWRPFSSYFIDFQRNFDLKKEESGKVLYAEVMASARGNAEVTDAMREAHYTNILTVCSGDIEKKYEEMLKGYEEQLNPKAQRSGAVNSFTPQILIHLYQNRIFQHWLTQLVLWAVAITALLVVTAFMVKATMLPMAVAKVVAGLSDFASKAIFGTALTVGLVTTAVLIHSRFFVPAAAPASGSDGSSLELLRNSK